VHGAKENRVINSSLQNIKQMETSLTLENITGIIQAMDKIKHSDKSDFFIQYYAELKYRIYAEEQLQKGEECILFSVFLKNIQQGQRIRCQYTAAASE
jgi:hypothetical protein